MKASIFLLALAMISCQGPEPVRDAPPAEKLPPPAAPRKLPPALRIRDYKNRDSGAALALWLRTYLNGGIGEAESLGAYRDSYLFIAGMYNSSRTAVDQWLRSFSAARDFSRLAAERIRFRLDRDADLRPGDFYGPNYELAVKAAYRASFRGARMEDSSWVLSGDGKEDLYWGFVLLSIPREVLEPQVSGLLDGISTGRNREQTAAFNNVKERFFEQF
ncbi:MAG: hypothetical protein LBD31_01905 [Treponema sp.]|nr:hypothetical protein [Treponema sp.]